jgi:cytochrome b6-f complex iron-sulfur subunit
MGWRRRTDLVEDLLRDRRPDWSWGDLDPGTVGVAVVLAAARPGASVVRPHYLANLEGRLARELGTAGCSGGRAPIDRRRLLTAAGVAAAGALGGGFVDHLGTGAARWSVVEQANVADDGLWQTVTTTSELADLGVVRFATQATVGFVAATNGVLRAVSGVCTHQGCLLTYEHEDRELACPCHRATFALSGEPRAHDVEGVLRPLPQLPVRERDGRIEVYLAAGSGGASSSKPLQT